MALEHPDLSIVDAGVPRFCDSRAAASITISSSSCLGMSFECYVGL